MSFKILHLADLHLDRAFHGADNLAALGQPRRDGLRRCLQRGLALARERAVDVLTVGGDLLDAEYLSPDTALFLREQFATLAPTRVVIAPGNRDPYNERSAYALVDWSANVFVFRQPLLTPLSLTDELDLWGVAYDAPSFARPVLSGFALPSSRPAILLLHGGEQSVSPPNGRGISFSAHEVQRAGFQLALLGHVHARHDLSLANALVHYPGSPEPLGFDEPDAHSVLLAEWDAGRWRVEPVDVSQMRYRTTSLDVSAFASPAELEARIQEQAHAEADAIVVQRILLTGRPLPAVRFSLPALIGRASDMHPRLRIEDRTGEPHDLALLGAEQTVRGALARHFQAAQEHAPAQRALAADALRYALLALDGQAVTP